MSEKSLISHILVCKDLEKAKEHIEKEYENYRVVSFFVEKEFSIDDAKNVVKEAYVAESQIKLIILGATSYNIYSQNALLKILEEPPKNIVFILVTTSKTGFLPTIRSRLTLKELRVEKEIVSSGLILDKLDVAQVYEFIQKNTRVSKIELKSLVQNIVHEAINKYKLSFTNKELEYFGHLIELVELNTRAQNILSSLLMSIMLRKRNEVN